MYTTSAIFLPEVREFTKSGAMQLSRWCRHPFTGCQCHAPF